MASLTFKPGARVRYCGPNPNWLGAEFKVVSYIEDYGRYCLTVTRLPPGDWSGLFVGTQCYLTAFKVESFDGLLDV